MSKGIYYRSPKLRSIIGKRSRIHGFSHTRFYEIWIGIKKRCYIKNCINFKYYGGRNIRSGWKSFIEFKNDMYESYLKHVEKFGKKQTTIDRINNDRNYSKENCRWATYEEQANNKRNNKFICYNKKCLTIREWSNITKIPFSVLSMRIWKKWKIKKILTQPVGKQGGRK